MPSKKLIKSTVKVMVHYTTNISPRVCRAIAFRAGHPDREATRVEAQQFLELNGTNGIDQALSDYFDHLETK